MITVEDGTVVSGANSYVTVSGVMDYAIDHGYEATWSGTDVTDTHREQAVHNAMRYIESLNYRGIRQTKDQPLQFPRSNVYDDSDYLMDENFIPTQLKNAVCEAAMLMLPTSEIDLEPDVTRDSHYVAAEALDGVTSVAYTIGSGGIKPMSTKIYGLLREFLKNKVIGTIKRG